MLQLKSIFFIFALTLLTSGVRGEWRWEGKVAVVTGASSGIGAEIAVTLAERGVIVVGLARREEKIKDLLKRTNGTIHAVKCDLLNEEDVLKAFRWVEKNLGGVDILVNNAGITKYTNLIDGQVEDWKSVMDLNVISLNVCTREALKSMRKRGDNGHIININSILGHTVPKFKGFPFGIYPASKFALTALTEGLAYELSELQSNIKVTSLSPGVVATELFSNVTANYLRENPDAEAQIHAQVFIEPINIAEGVVYILSTRANVQSLSPGLVLTEKIALVAASEAGKKLGLEARPSIDPSDVAEGVAYVLSTRPNVQIPELTIQAVRTPLCG